MRFQPPPGFQPVYNPVLPYAGPIYGGLKPGMSLYVRGTVHNVIDRFAINLQNGLVGDCDILLHFNPRFMHGEVVVMNSRGGGRWGSEEMPSEMPFRKGESFQMLISVTSLGYQINVNGSGFHFYKHRMPVEQVSGLSITGDVTVHVVSANGGGAGHVLGYPGLGQMVRIPYVGPIYGGLKPGMSVHIQGAVPCDVVRFHVSLQTAEAKCSDRALYINPRFKPAESVVFNSFRNGIFEEQERLTDMPFTLGDNFELVITATDQGYQVNVNGREYHMFPHRMPLASVLALAIAGDVSVQSINIIGGEQGVLAWPGPGYIGSDAYKQPLPGGLKEGMSVYLRGTVPPQNVDRFDVNLVGGDDIAIHCNPRFVGWSGVVFNSRQNGAWNEEEKVDEMPCRQGAVFELVFFVTSEGYQVSIGGRQVLMYKHRVPLEQVTDLVIGGDVSVQTITIIKDEDKKESPAPEDKQVIPAPGDVSSEGFSHSIDGGLAPGMSLYFKGKVHSESDRFDINLHAGDDLVMHFNPRFGGWNLVVFNSREGGSWKSEERPEGMPFSKGEDFQLLFNVTSEGYQVMVNGSVFHLFKHRVPVDGVNSMSIGGGVSIEDITIMKEEDKPESSAPEDEQGVIPAPGDVSSEGFSHSIDGGLSPGMSLYFEGKAHSDSDRFDINLHAGDDLVMHFNPRFGDWNLVVFNSREGGGWKSEERPEGMPFSKGEDFQLVFNVTSEGYQVIVNGSMLHLFKHRVSVDGVNSMSIGGGVSIQKISIVREQSLIQEFPAPGDVKAEGYTQPIEGGLKTGMLLQLQGTVASGDVNRFAVNLMAGDDLAVHFNPRFRGWKLVVFNTRQNGRWQSEERPKEMPFSEGASFVLLFNVTLKGYEVIVNGRMLHMYKHRIPLDLVNTLSISGDVSMHNVTIIKGSTGSTGGVGLGYNWRFLPMISTQPIYNPPVPYTRMIPGGLTLKKTLVFSGKVAPDANRFYINFIVGSTGEIPLHLNPRQDQGAVVRNSLLDGNWGWEEKNVKFNPFHKGQHFEIMIRCGKLKFMVFVNGKHIFDFSHRYQPFTKIDTLGIGGDVELSYIII